MLERIRILWTRVAAAWVSQSRSDTIDKRSDETCMGTRTGCGTRESVASLKGCLDSVERAMEGSGRRWLASTDSSGCVSC